MENEGDISFSGNNIAQFRLRLIVLFVCSVTRNLQYNMICYRITRTFRFASIDINNSKHKKQIGLFYMYSGKKNTPQTFRLAGNLPE